MFEWAELMMQIVAWSSKKYQERNLHTTIPVFIAGACFMCTLTWDLLCDASSFSQPRVLQCVPCHGCLMDGKSTLYFSQTLCATIEEENKT